MTHTSFINVSAHLDTVEGQTEIRSAMIALQRMGLQFVLETVPAKTEKQFDKQAAQPRRRVCHHGVRILGMAITSETAVLPPLIVDRLIELIRDREFGNPQYMRLCEAIVHAHPVLRMVIWQPTQTLEHSSWSWGQAVTHKRCREEADEIEPCAKRAAEWGSVQCTGKRAREVEFDLAADLDRTLKRACVLPQYSMFAAGESLGAHDIY